jgi:hypothetical protein
MTMACHESDVFAIGVRMLLVQTGFMPGAPLTADPQSVIPARSCGLSSSASPSQQSRQHMAQVHFNPQQQQQQQQQAVSRRAGGCRGPAQGC